jgi:hypothetical protein
VVVVVITVTAVAVVIAVVVAVVAGFLIVGHLFRPFFGSALGRERVAAVAVAAGDAAVLIVDAQLRALIAADGAAALDGFALGFVVAAGAFSAAAFHIPSPVRVRDDMVGLRPFTHRSGLLDLLPRGTAVPHIC